MYTCGITPYDATHLGHASAYLTYDVLQRRLRDLGHETRCVRNITDVDDSILGKARELGVHYLDLAAAETARFDDDMEPSACSSPWSEPRATSAIADIRGFIGMVLDRGHAYQAGGGVYFDVSTFPEFGQCRATRRDEMLELCAASGAATSTTRTSAIPLDFVLWQPSADDEPSWESLWGPGRPGWHIECSALALRELGTTIDLHGGGADLIFPHHECEAAQSEAATGEPFVRHWMHQAMVRMDGEKMSKSLGNLVFVSDLRKQWDPLAIRLARREPLPHEWEWDDAGMLAPRPERSSAGGPPARAPRRPRRAASTTTSTPPALAPSIDAAAARGEGGRPPPPCSASPHLTRDWSTRVMTVAREVPADDRARPGRRPAAAGRERGAVLSSTKALWPVALHVGLERIPTRPAILCPNHTS